MPKDLSYKENRHSNYFEAILQLRPCNEKLMDFVLKRIKERENVNIVKEVLLKTGIDLYLTDQRFTRALGKQLKRQFKGELILSRKLHTRNRMTSKNIYRVTVCFKLNEERKDPEYNF
ncbi:MAG: NMD3-related protein [Nanoarchaeota archaeon]